MAYRVRADGQVRFTLPIARTVLAGAVAVATAGCIGFADPELELEEPGEFEFATKVVIPDQVEPVPSASEAEGLDPCLPDEEELESLRGMMPLTEEELALREQLGEAELKRREQLLELERAVAADQTPVEPKPL